MLLVVLLSAVPSGEQARTRLVGSAFDPATVSVALTPKQPKTKAAVQAERRRLPELAFGKAPFLLAIASAGAVPFAGYSLVAPVGFVRPAPFPASRSLTRAHGPRAPPRA